MQKGSFVQKHAGGVFVVWVYLLSTIFFLGPNILQWKGLAPNSVIQVMLYGIYLVPAVVGIYLVYRLRGGNGVAEMLQKLTVWKVGLGWYLVTLLIPLVVLVLAKWIYHSFYAPVSIVPRWGEMSLLTPFLIAALGEEIGWRGFLLPRLQERWGALASSIWIGIFWSIWVMPMAFFGMDMGELALIFLFIQFILLSICFTWIYNNTGSLLIAVLFHMLFNATNFVTDVYSNLEIAAFSDLILFLIVFGILCVNGGKHLSRKKVLTRSA